MYVHVVYKYTYVSYIMYIVYAYVYVYVHGSHLIFHLILHSQFVQRMFTLTSINQFVLQIRQIKGTGGKNRDRIFLKYFKMIICNLLSTKSSISAQTIDYNAIK